MAKPNFNFYQAPPGPDASRQYSDWNDAILAQGEALNRPLQMLLQGMIESKLQRQRANAQAAEGALDREAKANSEKAEQARSDRWYGLQKEQGDRAYADRMTERSDKQAQDVANTEALLSLLAPRNAVEQPSATYQGLQAQRDQMPSVLRPGMPSVGILSTIAQAEDGRERRAATEREAESRRAGLRAYIDTNIGAGYVDKADAPMLQAYIDSGDEAGLHREVEKRRSNSEKLGDRKRLYKEIEAYTKANPDDARVKQYAKALPILKAASELKDASGTQEYWDQLAKQATEGIYGTGKSGTASSKPEKFVYAPLGTSGIEVPEFVRNGAAVEALPPEVENFINSVAVEAMDRDKRISTKDREMMFREPDPLDSESPKRIQAARSKWDSIYAEHVRSVKQQLGAQYGWSIVPPQPKYGLPYGLGAQQSAFAEPQAAAAPSAPQPQASPLSELTPQDRAEALRLMQTDPAKARAFLIEARMRPYTDMKGSVTAPKTAPVAREPRGTMQ